MNKPEHKRSFFLGALVGSLFVTIVAVIWIHFPFNVVPHWAYITVVFLVALMGSLVIGLPIVTLLRKIHRLSWFSILLSATVTANLYTLMIAYLISEHYRVQDVIFSSILGLLMGLGFCFGSWPHRFFGRSN